jgi:hypothetical protein
MADIDQCSVWPLLRFVEFYRFYQDDKAYNVFPTFRLPYELDVLEIASASWDST